MLEVRTEIHLHPRVKCDYRCTDFHEPHVNHPVTFVDIFCARLYPYRKENAEMGSAFVRPEVKCGFQCIDFHETCDA